MIGSKKKAYPLFTQSAVTRQLRENPQPSQEIKTYLGKSMFDQMKDCQTENLYPLLPTSPDTFRVQKISDVQNELEREADHYRQVAKRYKKAFTIAHASAIGLGFDCCAFFSWNSDSSNWYRRFRQCAYWGRGCFNGNFLYAFNRVQ